MRCPDCSKFASLETAEPEVDLNAEISEDNKTVTVSGSVRLVRTCVDCGTELKETTFDVEETLDLSGEGIDPKAEVESVDLEVADSETTESGGGRYKKNMIGFHLTYIVTIPWKLGKDEGEATVEGTIKEEVQASAFDEMV